MEFPPNPLNIPKKLANYLLDLVLGAEEPFEFTGSTTPELEEV